MTRLTFVIALFLGAVACNGCGDDSSNKDASAELDAGAQDSGSNDGDVQD